MADPVVEPVAPVVEPTATPTPAPEKVEAVVAKTEPVGEPEQKTVPIHRFNDVYRRSKDLERENEALRRSQTPVAPIAPEPGISEPKMKDFGEETDPVAVKRFNEAWVDHRAELKLQGYKQQQAREQVNQAADQRRREAGNNLQNRLVSAAAKTPEIYDAVSTFDRYGFHEEFSTVVAESEKNVELIDFMANNPGEALRLRNMPLSRSLHELGRIESKLQSGNSKPEPKITKATPPPDPVSAEHQTIDISRMSQKEYNTYMNKRVQGY